MWTVIIDTVLIKRMKIMVAVLIKIQKHGIFVRPVIMIAFLIKKITTMVAVL